MICRFQSTRPVWGATCFWLHMFEIVHVSIHAPRVGRDSEEIPLIIYFRSFNPRAPCGARQQNYKTLPEPVWFQSTRPVWGATTLSASTKASRRFQSTRPVWGATISVEAPDYHSPFQSTRPVWGATRQWREYEQRD